MKDILKQKDNFKNEDNLNKREPSQNEDHFRIEANPKNPVVNI